MAEATWIKSGEVWCPDCGTGHTPTLKNGQVVVECDHQLTEDEQRAKYVLSQAGTGSAVGQAVSAAEAAAAASSSVAEHIGTIVADKVGAAVGAAIAKALSGAPPAPPAAAAGSA